MNDSKHYVAVTLVSGLAMTSFLVLMTALKGDNTLRIVLASVGFVGFAGLMAALLVSKIKARRSVQP
jgi:hypothetical protein